MRARLTLVYGGLFLLAGVTLLGVTYVLFNQQLHRSPDTQVLLNQADRTGVETGTFSPEEAGELAPPAAVEAREWMEEQRAGLYRAASTSLLTQGAVALAGVGALAGASGWLIAGRVLRPLHRVTETARRIAAAPIADQGLGERIALRGRHDEVKELADTFDTMVERLARSFDGQRRFVANASHELRTPLTLNRALVELAMRRGEPPREVMELGESLLEINARHEQVISGLLLLAHSEREIAERSWLDLADVVSHVVAQTADEAKRSGVTVEVAADRARTTGDALLLERLVHNLVENGIRHNTDDGTGWVRVVSRTTADGRAGIEVGNSGPVVPVFEVPALFQPFHRAGGDRTITSRSAGLGLSIARSVVRAHGGEITARPRARGGLVVTVVLPLPTPA
jgi:signal transduction histidine kinase